MFRDTSEVGNDANTAPRSRAHRITSYVEQLRDELQNLLDSEALYLEHIQKLDTELSAFKRAYTNVDFERQQLQTLKEETDKQMNLLENQLQGYRIITLIDGDGAIFTNELISRGQAGGHTAAQMLSDTILQFLTSNYGGHQYQLWVYLFFNKRGLMDTFGRVGSWLTKTKFEDFCMGFNEAAERFLMVDVGSRKEAADAKIKAHLEAEIFLPQTYKIIFGGCHDNGYVTNLRSQITAGFKQKLILLPTYTEIAAGIAELELPVLTIRDLFLKEKLGIAPSDPIVPPGLGSLATSSRVRPTQTTVAVPGPDDNEKPDTRSGLVTESDIPQQYPSSYSSAAYTGQKRYPIRDRDSISSTGTDNSDEVINYHPTTFNGSRRINSNLALTKHNPPPCTLFYLANCKVGANCRYGHDYILKPEHFDELRDNAKKVPCVAVNKGEPCGWGDKCCWGHHCPLASKCFYLKLGRCRFVGADMHKEPKNQD
ncbi:hypothetical protein L208DRAFT_1429576 [Tricholoma matsutake]|nr:hypothetical protein L208DRAFT_1429576 [Tricholoma matsutake 945]